MKDVIRWISKFMFYVLAGAVIVWTGSLTVGLVSRLLPGDAITPLFALALFDGGALVWMLAFLFHAEGLPQRGVTLLAMALDLLGVIGVSIAELFLGGQQLADVPEGLGTMVVWGIGIFTAINLLAVYLFHLTNPNELQEIKVRTLQDRITDEALRQVDEQITAQAQALAAQVAVGMRVRVLAQLHLLPAPANDQVIDLPAHMPAGPEGERRAYASTGNAGPAMDPTQARTSD